MFLAVFFLEKYVLSSLNTYISLIIQIVTGGIIYLGLLFVLKDNSLKELISFVKTRK